MSDITAAVEAAAQKRLREKGLNPSDDSDDARCDLLLGECQQNAAAVRDELQARGISCTVVCGALRNAYPPGDEPASADEARKDGFGVHYWVEANGRVCEAASESELHYGEAIASPLAPEKLGYIKFDDSEDATVPF